MTGDGTPALEPAPDRVDALTPPDPPPSRARVVAAALLAAIFGLTGYVLAPAPWSAGPARFEVRYLGDHVATATLEVGGVGPVLIAGTTEGSAVTVELADGVPTAAPTTARISVTRDERPIRPGLGDVGLALLLPDGREEAIPVVRWDDEADELVATRRPPVGARVVLALLGAVVVLWVTAVVPLFVTSLAIPVVLTVAGTAAAADALAPFFHPIIALFFGGFLMAEAMRRVGLDERIAVTIVSRAGRGPRTLFWAMLGTAAFLSMWMSNTAAVAVLIPISLAVTAPLADLGYRKVVVLGIAYAATIGGVGSAIGTPANPLAIEFLDTFAGRHIGFVEWFGFGLPMLALFLPLMGSYLWWRADVRVDVARFHAAHAAAVERLARMPRPSRHEVQVIAVFVGVAAVWLAQSWHGIDTGIVAIAGAVVLAALGRIQPADLGRISWASLLTFGGGLALGLALTEAGVSDWIATRLGGLATLPGPVAVAIVAAVALATTTVASNTATAAMLIPLAIPLAGVLGVEPTVLVVVVAIASSIDFALVIGTPPTLLAYSTGLFTPTEILRRGGALDLLGLAVLVTAVAATWELLGLT